jgi:hypothetical protein
LFGPTVFGNVNNNVAGVRTFLGVNNFWKCKTTMWQAFERFWGSAVFGNAKQQCGRRSNVFGGQQFLEIQKNNVARVRTFCGVSSFWKCKTTMWQAFEICWGQQFLEMQNNNVAGVRTFWGSSVFGNVKHFTFTFPKSVDLNKLPNFPKSVDLNKLPNFLFSFSLAITYEISGGEFVKFIPLITNIQPPTEYVSNIILQLTVTNMARMRSLNDTQHEASRT